MSRIYNLLFLFLLGSTLAYGQSERVVLVEEFTNVGCGPCAAQNPAFNALLDGLKNQNVISIKYQTAGPGPDPMNALNQGGVQARATYYNVSGVPTALYDGKEFTGSAYEGAPANATAATLTGRQAEGSPVAVTVEHSFLAGTDSLEVTVNVVNEATEEYDASGLNLRVALTERLIEFRSAPGSNGEMEFENVFRAFINEGGAGGTGLKLMAAEESVEFKYAVAVPTYYDLRELEVLAFIQNDSSKEVVQAGLSDAVELENVVDLDVKNATGDVGYCDDSVLYQVELYNNGAADITSASIALVIGGEVVETKEFADLSIAPGQSEIMDFGTYDAVRGTTSLAYAMTEVNGEDSDISSLNNVSLLGSYHILQAGADLLDATFDDYGYDENGPLTDESSYADALVNISAADFEISGSIGGYAQSDRSLLVNYYGWNPATTDPVGYMSYGIMDLSSTVNPRLIMDRAKRTYSGENDRMEIQVSTDCGANWSNIYNAAGSNLLTVSGNLTDFYLPSAGDWVTDTISLVDYAGAEEVSLRFKFTTAWGNNMYLDNIRIEETPAGVNEIVNEDLLTVYPNPVNSRATLEVNLVETQDVTLIVTDMMGKVVDQVNYGKLSGNNKLPYAVNHLATGNYLFKINAGIEAVVRKISVIK